MAPRKKKSESKNEVEEIKTEAEVCTEDVCEDCDTKKVETEVEEGDSLIKLRVKHGYRLHVDGKFYNRGSILTVAASKVADQKFKYEVLKDA